MYECSKSSKFVLDFVKSNNSLVCSEQEGFRVGPGVPLSSFEESYAMRYAMYCTVLVIVEKKIRPTWY